MATAFKEWQIVCDALASGRQSILLRKGGIHEGREGFSFAHDSFYLFPTKFHAQSQQVREGDFTPETEWQVGDPFEITHYCIAEFAVTLTDWDRVEALFPHHIFTAETLRERFDWEGKGMATGSIHLAFVRTWKLAEPLRLNYEKRFGGCRSWLDIPREDPRAVANSVPVLDDTEFARISEEIREIAEVPSEK